MNTEVVKMPNIKFDFKLQ